MELRNIKISDKELTLTNVEVNVVGPEVVFERCTVHSDCAGGALIVAGLTMVEGEFIQKRRLANFHFSRAHFHGVKFSGNFVGCDFGDWDTTEKASVQGCDFSQATLDGCRFLNCDMQTIRIPKWPCFTIFNPSQARDFVLGRDWPSSVGDILDVYTDEDPECVAICGDAVRIAEKKLCASRRVPGVAIDSSRH